MSGIFVGELDRTDDVQWTTQGTDKEYLMLRISELLKTDGAPSHETSQIGGKPINRYLRDGMLGTHGRTTQTSAVEPWLHWWLR